MNRRDFLSLIPAAAVAAPAPEPEWPQWRGPRRDSVSHETGLAKSWPANGPAVLWSVKGLGAGYGSLAIKGDRIYVQGVKGSESTVFALDRAKGNTVWAAALGRALDQDRGGGPRGTPTIDGDSLYVLSENGDLACISARDGKFRWRKNILQEFRGDNPHWLISESPLIDGDRVIVTPGGPGACVVALNKNTGATVWTSKDLSDSAGYASCIVHDIGGVRTIMNLTGEAGVGVRASDGKLLWRYTQVSNRTANCTTPVYAGNKVFYTSAYGTGCALLDLKPGGGEVKASEMYFNRDMMNHHGGVVLHEGHLYGFSNQILTCMEFATGKTLWRDRSVGKGSLMLAEGHLYLLGEGHTAGLAIATPAGYQEKGRFRIEDQGRPSWAHPVVCGGKLYIRNQGMLTCYNVKA